VGSDDVQAPSSNITGTSRKLVTASRTARRSVAARAAELMKTRTRWSGVRITSVSALGLTG
jgi:hypothetical protein